MTVSEISSIVTNDTQGSPVYPHHRFFFLIGIQSTQGWAATKKDRSTKKEEKDEMYKANLIRESQNIIGA